MKQNNELKFEWNGHCYNIPFMYYPITQIKGYSSTGKSLLVHDLRQARLALPELKNSLVIDYMNKEHLGDILKKKYEYVVIDNADVLLTEAMDEYIYEDVTAVQRQADTKYIIMGRKFYTCAVLPACIGNLIHWEENGKDCFSVDFSGVV